MNLWKRYIEDLLWKIYSLEGIKDFDSLLSNKLLIVMGRLFWLLGHLSSLLSS